MIGSILGGVRDPFTTFSLLDGRSHFLVSKGRSQFLITILPLLKSLEDRAQHGVASQSQYIHPFLHKKLDAYQIP